MAKLFPTDENDESADPRSSTNAKLYKGKTMSINYFVEKW